MIPTRKEVRGTFPAWRAHRSGRRRITNEAFNYASLAPHQISSLGTARSGPVCGQKNQGGTQTPAGILWYVLMHFSTVPTQHDQPCQNHLLLAPFPSALLIKENQAVCCDCYAGPFGTPALLTTRRSFTELCVRSIGWMGSGGSQWMARQESQEASEANNSPYRVPRTLPMQWGCACSEGKQVHGEIVCEGS